MLTLGVIVIISVVQSALDAMLCDPLYFTLNHQVLQVPPPQSIAYLVFTAFSAVSLVTE
jgi:hypothetical protein